METGLEVLGCLISILCAYVGDDNSRFENGTGDRVVTDSSVPHSDRRLTGLLVGSHWVNRKSERMNEYAFERSV